jgi:hypothetical protein
MIMRIRHWLALVALSLAPAREAEIAEELAQHLIVPADLVQQPLDVAGSRLSHCEMFGANDRPEVEMPLHRPAESLRIAENNGRTFHA